jgi:signal transduction histidine kinase
MSFGADDYLTKPFSREDLINAVNLRINRRQYLTQQSTEQLESLRRNLAIALPHELRTPLQGIITCAELLDEYWETLEKSEIQEITNNIRVSADRLHDLIQKFLLYSKLDLAVYQPEEFRQRNLDQTVVNQLLMDSITEKIAQKYPREQDLKFDLELARILISESWFSILTRELIDNAFKFSIPLDTTQKTKPIIIRSRINNDQWVLEIQDQGRGMTTEQVEQIGAYMQFNRQHYEQQGAGLGLAIAQRIIQLYHGTINFFSVVDQGTTVTVTLPIDGENELYCDEY